MSARTPLSMLRNRVQAARGDWHARRRGPRFAARYGFDPPPEWSDITGYEPMLDVILDQGLDQLHGDVLEIGVFLGGGTQKLSNLLRLRAPGRRVVAVDIFDPAFDETPCTNGVTMAAVYDEWLAARDATQREIFDWVTRGCSNLDVVAGDSTAVEIPTDRLAFSFIDGHHAADYVRKDFQTAWSRTLPGGVVALHDYGHDLPSVTHTVNALIGEHADEIARVWAENIIVFLQRER